MNGVGKDNYISVKGAKENNLKNISVDIPLHQLVGVTGVSGGGKSSLVYDTLYAESRRVLFDSMDINLFGQKMLERPNVDSIDNLRPAVSLSQNNFNSNPRSTVGTVTEISYALRNIFSLATRGEKKSNYFSFNNADSYCPQCKGTGVQLYIDQSKIIPDHKKTINQGAIAYFGSKKNTQEFKLLAAFCLDKNIDMDTSFSNLKVDEIDMLLNTDEVGPYDISFKTPKGRSKKKSLKYIGAIKDLNEKITKTSSKSTMNIAKKYATESVCRLCGGEKLSQKVLEIKLLDCNISDVESMNISDCINWFKEVKKDPEIGEAIKSNEYLLDNSIRKLYVLKDVSVDYLTLGRSVPTLSSGEMQRVRIAKHLSSSLSGLVYIFDEPCKGLHPRNIAQIKSVISNLVSEGNTVISIEHNKQFLKSIDYIFEMGPVGGPRGGYLLRHGEASLFDDITDVDYSLKSVARYTNQYIKFNKINYRNIRNQNVKIPKNSLSCITGVSGSGKSTLVRVIMDCVSMKKAVNCESIEGIEDIDGFRYINQAPIGKTRRSTVVSYLGIYDQIRNIFSNSTEARQRKVPASYFSMNLPGGRCENCQGTGRKKIEVEYFPETYIKCDICEGKRFTDEILQIKVNGYNIYELLDEEIENLISYFANEVSIKTMLQCLIDVGLGYLKLGQLSMDISGGEAQRIKLAKGLGKKTTQNYVYFFDEPTNGLGYQESQRIGCLLSKLCDDNNTVIVIEHNLEFLLGFSDYIIDLGMNGGEKGGIVRYQGQIEGVFRKEDSSWFDMQIHLF